MDHHRLCTTGLSNELLTLWLKARDGLSCEEARDLIERLARTEQDAEADARDADENLNAACIEERAEGRIDGWCDLRDKIQEALYDAEGETADHDTLQAIQNILSNDSP